MTAEERADVIERILNKPTNTTSRRQIILDHLRAAQIEERDRCTKGAENSQSVNRRE